MRYSQHATSIGGARPRWVIAASAPALYPITYLALQFAGEPPILPKCSIRAGPAACLAIPARRVINRSHSAYNCRVFPPQLRTFAERSSRLCDVSR